MNIFNIFNILLPSDSGHGFVTLDTERKIQADWKKISEFLATRQPAQIRQALLIADRSLDAALKEVVAGETMGQRLKNARDYFDRDMYNKIWEAHKIRNNLVHEADYDPPYYVVGDAIATLKSGLSKLKVNLS